MKYIVLVLLLAAILPLSAQWQPNGNNMKLSTGLEKVRDYVLSEDGKFIYTQSDSGIISKWDAITGTQIFRHKIVPDSTRQLTANWLFLSSDGKTYSVAYSAIQYNSPETRVYVFDLENDNLIASSKINFNPNSSDYYQPNMGYNFVDYNMAQKSLIISYNDFYYDTPPFSSHNTGHFEIRIPSDTGMALRNDITGVLFGFSITKDKSKLYIYRKNDDWSSYPDHTRNRNEDWLASNFINFNLDQSVIISNYYHYSEQGFGTKDDGVDIPFSSSMFSNDEKILNLITYNKIYQYNTDPFDTIQIKSLGVYPAQNIYKLSNSIENNYFFIYNGKTLNLHDKDSLFRCKTLMIDGCNSIVKTLNSPDSLYLYASEDKGFIFRLKNSDIFKLSANFTSSDTIFSQFDTVKFFDCSVGYHDTFSWDFGDGNTSTEKNPTHIYSEAGYYHVKLIVKKGNATDTVIKTNFINILPLLKADFDYLITGNFPVAVKFTNKSTGIIDSLEWDFGDSSTSREDNPVKIYNITGNYKVTLKIFSKTVISKITKIIPINIMLNNLDMQIFPYELTDTLHYNAIAIKGYAENGNLLVYHIKDSINYLHGVFKNKNIDWQSSSKVKDFMIFKRPNTYIYMGDTIIEDVDTKNMATNISHNKHFANSINITSINGNLTRTYFNNFYNLDELDSSNKLIDTLSIRYREDEYYWEIVYFNLFNFIAYKINKIIDFAYCIDFKAYPANASNPLYRTIININSNVMLTFFKFTDFFRQNDSLLIFAGDGFVNSVVNFGYSPDTSIHLSQVCYIRDSVKLPGIMIKSLLKLSDTSFAVAGSYKNSPAVLILNDHGAVLDSVTLSDRFGEFEFVSDTPDSMLLLSGYRYATYGVKSPYFVKFNYKSVPVDTSSIDNHPQDSTKNQIPGIIVYPNPTFGTATFSFSQDKSGDVSLMIYDAYGNLMHDETKNFSGGDNSFKVDFTPFSTGMFYYKLQNSSGTKYGTVVFLR